MIAPCRAIKSSLRMSSHLTQVSSKLSIEPCRVIKSSQSFKVTKDNHLKRVSKDFSKFRRRKRSLVDLINSLAKLPLLMISTPLITNQLKLIKPFNFKRRRRLRLSTRLLLRKRRRD